MSTSLEKTSLSSGTRRNTPHDIALNRKIFDYSIWGVKDKDVLLEAPLYFSTKLRKPTECYCGPWTSGSKSEIMMHAAITSKAATNRSSKAKLFNQIFRNGQDRGLNTG